MRHPVLLRQAVAILCTTAGLTFVSAQTPTPSGRPQRPPVTMHPHDLDASFIRMPLPANEQQYGKLDGDHIKEFVREIVGVSEQSKKDGELLWGRVAGTKYDDMVEGIVDDLPGGSVMNQMWDVVLMPGRFGVRIATTVLKRE